MADCISRGQYPIRRESGDSDGDENRQCVPPNPHFADQNHNCGDGAGTREHRNTQRNDSHIVFCRTLLGFAGSFLGLGPARLEHIQADQHQDDASGNLEGRKRDPKNFEDQSARQSEAGQYDEAGPCGALGHVPPPGRIGIRGHDQKRRNRSDGINQEKDGSQRNEQELDQRRDRAQHRAASDMLP